MPQSVIDLLPSLVKRNNNEYAGACPWCGGSDRFIVWPHQGHGGRYLCRQCQRKGDGIDFLRDQGMSFNEAKTLLNKTPLPSNAFCKFGKNGAEHSKSSVSNKGLWKTAAQNFIEQSAHKKGVDRHQILIKKAINEVTASKFNIGWNDRDQYLPASDWGLNDKKIRIPAGLVIPIYKDKEIISIKIRCRDHINNPKY